MAINLMKTTQEYVRDRQFFRELEIVLDEQFPKIYIEGEEKRLMKRGDALTEPMFYCPQI